RKRMPLSSIKFPHKTSNMNAIRFALRISDVIWVTALILLGIWNAYIGINNKDVIAPLAAGALGAVGFIGALMAMKAHQFAPTETYGQHMKKVGLAAFAALGLWLSTALILRPDTFLPDALAIAGITATAGVMLLHSLYYSQIRRMHESGQIIPTIIMLGATESARRLIEENARTRELNILAIFDDRLSRAPHNIYGVPVVGKIEDMLEWDALPYVDRIVVTLPGMAEARKQAFIEQVRLLPNRIAFVVDEFEDLDHVQQRLTQIAEVGMREYTGTPKSGRHTFLKRIMDIGIGTTALVVGAPFLALIAIAIRLDTPGPIFFKQKRHGFNNRVFDVYKFRSFRTDVADPLAKNQVIKGDGRITRVGKFIRKTSFDELPQLLNVIKGQMSLVGPRPHAVGMHTGDIETYRLVDEYAHRHKVKPGMTGWAQINGSRGPLHDAESVALRVKYDLEYIERSNWWFDLVIMAKTIPCLLGDSENVR
ncbi:MAG: exopolysaccharide biosynthesis polyprenyl glycosylphosphotransferase, partial [Acidimicrobiales bacterium]